MKLGRKRATSVKDLRCDLLIKEFLNIIDEQDFAINYIADKSGVSLQTIMRWQNTSIPNLYNFRAVLQSIGYDLEIKK